MERWSLYHGESYAWLRSLPSDSVDIVITDPPYSSGGQFRSDRMRGTSEKYVNTGQIKEYADFEGDNRDQRAFLAWASLWMYEAGRVVNDNGLLVVFTDWRQLPTMTDAVQAGGWVWRGIVPWNKGRACRPLPQGFRSGQCEYLVWASRGTLTWDVSERLVDGFLTASPDPGDGFGLTTSAPPEPADIVALIGDSITMPVERGDDKVHPTQKPLDLMVQVCGAAPVGGLILDPFAGSGTTGVAALRTGRRFMGAESSAEYHRIASERLEAEARGSLSRSAAMAGQEPLFGG